MRVKTYTDALRIATAAGEDAANRRMRKAGRTAWSLQDHNHGAGVTMDILVTLGFDVPGWIAMAGVPRNEPPEPKAARRSKRRSKATPVQLSFAFA